MSMVTSSTEPVIGRYLDHLKVRNLRKWTIYNRQCALGRLGRWAAGPILYLTEHDLSRWQKERATQIQAEPLRTEMSHARQFYRWCVKEQLLNVDPTARLDMPRVSRRLPRPMRDAALLEAMDAADTPVRVMLALAGFAGLRAHEIAQLDWCEIGLGDKHPHIRVVDGKGGHGRIIPLSTALATELSALTHRRGPVIKRLDGRPGQCAAHRISVRANDHLHSLGIVETLHQCRHRFASTTYQACRDIRAVQDLLGHASPTTTAIYAASASAVAVQAVEDAGTFAAWPVRAVPPPHVVGSATIRDKINPGEDMHRRTIAAAAAAVLLAACSSGPGKITVNGTMTLSDITTAIQGCVGQSGYEDIADGTPVVISDDSGKTLALTSLTGGTADKAADAELTGTCTYKFTATVPGGKKFYGVEVSHRGVVKESEAEIKSPAVTLGSL